MYVKLTVNGDKRGCDRKKITSRCFLSNSLMKFQKDTINLDQEMQSFG